MSVELWAAKIERALTEEEAEIMMALLPAERHCAPIIFYAARSRNSTVGGNFPKLPGRIWESPIFRSIQKCSSA